MVLGDSVYVIVDFWVEVGCIYVIFGVFFRFWYVGRVVGIGWFKFEDGEGLL